MTYSNFQVFVYGYNNQIKKQTRVWQLYQETQQNLAEYGRGNKLGTCLLEKLGDGNIKSEIWTYLHSNFNPIISTKKNLERLT
jgi:hypothetical protein